jgi:hypothetical protein
MLASADMSSTANRSTRKKQAKPTVRAYLDCNAVNRV